MSLQDIVNVQISKQTSSVSRVGFGTPLILTFHNKFAGKTQIFTDATSMLTTAGGPFASTDLAFILANAAFAQDPRPDRVIVGRRLTAPLRDVTLTPRSGLFKGVTLPEQGVEVVYSVTISTEGTTETFNFTADVNATVAEITAGLTSLINAGTVNVKATDNTTDITIEKSDTPGGTPTAGEVFTITRDRNLMELHDNTADPGLADDIAAVQTENDDWYGIVGDWWGENEIDAVATTIEALPKLHGAATQDDDVYDSAVSNDIASNLQAKAFARTFLFTHPDPTIIASAFLGKNLPKDPGSITWKFKTLATVATEAWTAGELIEIQNKGAERYITLASNDITCDGKTLSGEFIDITRFVDFLVARLQEDVFFVLKNSDKVAFTDTGIAIIENAVRGVLNLGISVGGLSPDPAPKITVPRAADVSSIDKANRLLPDVDFEAKLAGAIHEVEIRGVVTV